jgi:cyclophilin family peptidyl-prolyl cis-trans isomerase
MSRRKVFVIAILAILAILVISKKSLRDHLLPTGLMTNQSIPLDNTVISPAPIPGHPRVEIQTSKGSFTVELRPDLAPKTVANFLAKWNSGYCTDKTFHRVEDWVVQGCDPKGDGTGGNTNLPTETSSASFTTGSLGVARRTTPKEVSNDSQFFIVKKDSQFLDGDYTYFGQVVSGMDVVQNLSVGDKITQTNVLSK